MLSSSTGVNLPLSSANNLWLYYWDESWVQQCFKLKVMLLISYDSASFCPMLSCFSSVIWFQPCRLPKLIVVVPYHSADSQTGTLGRRSPNQYENKGLSISSFANGPVTLYEFVDWFLRGQVIQAVKDFISCILEPWILLVRNWDWTIFDHALVRCICPRDFVSRAFDTIVQRI